MSGERKTVQHLEGGIVAGIPVAEGDAVAAGQHRPAAALEARRRFMR